MSPEQELPPRPVSRTEELMLTGDYPPPASSQSGKIGWALLWLLGIPLPVLLIIYLIRGH